VPQTLPLASLLGKTISYEVEPYEDGHLIHVFGEVVEVRAKEKDLEAALTLNAAGIRTTVTLNSDAITYGDFAIHEDHGADAGSELKLLHLDVRPAEFSHGMAFADLTFDVADRDQVHESFGCYPEDMTDKAMAETLVFLFTNTPIGIEAPLVLVLPGEKQIRVMASCLVKDPELFNTAVSVAGRESGRDDDWSPSCAGEAVFEAFLGANQSSAILDYGLELTTWTYPKTPSLDWEEKAWAGV